MKEVISNFCPRCGNKITKEQRFCSKCGNDLRVFEDDSIESQYEWLSVSQAFGHLNSWLSCYWDYSQLLFCLSFLFKRRGNKTTTTTPHLKKDKETTDDDKVSNDPIKAEKQKAKQSEDEKDKDAFIHKHLKLMS